MQQLAKRPRLRDGRWIDGNILGQRWTDMRIQAACLDDDDGVLLRLWVADFTGAKIDHGSNRRARESGYSLYELLVPIPLTIQYGLLV
jgi:hypothetical protein